MRPEITWHSPALDAALAESSDLWLEVANADDVAAAAPIVREFGLDPAHPLSTKITQSDVARVDAAVKSLGAPGESAFEPFRPWLASVTLSVVPLIRAGYDPKSGVDLQLKSIFSKATKPVRGFETIGQQMHLFADMPEVDQVSMLHSTLDQLGTASTTLDGLVDAWSKGEVDTFASLTQSGLSQGSPQFYERFVVARNADWAHQLEARLKQPGVTFVAVGAAHLAGKASVQADLERLGFSVRRLQ
ncbi:MAG: TraB/GumN family protein [Candidatus Eremiobacteraeota bacterium]|nr:TraB/GumN family protein [Candidatus Eremiobacteraeota bacterium]